MRGTPDVSTSLAKGSELEQRIEAFFRLNKYQTARNVIREGRSGAPHEIDVLATKSDGVTDFTMIVECKAWDMPIAKEVVSKLSMVMADLGVHKGIIVSLKGWTTGAELTAKQLGIELWGPDEIRDRLGQVAVAELRIGPSVRTGRGLSVRVPREDPTRRLIATARGFLGFGREDLVWIRLLWIPFFVIEIDHAKSRSTFLKGTVTQTTTRWNFYEGLSGSFFAAFEAAPLLEEVVLESSLTARVQSKKIERRISETLRKAQSVVRQTSKDRYASELREIGIPGDVEATSVTHVESIHVPFYTALLQSGDSQRLIAVDAIWGQRLHGVDGVLTENASYVIEAFGNTPGPEAATAAAARSSARPSAGWLGLIGAIAVGEFFIVSQQPAQFLALLIGTLGVIGFLALRAWRGEQAYS